VLELLGRELRFDYESDEKEEEPGALRVRSLDREGLFSTFAVFPRLSVCRHFLCVVRRRVTFYKHSYLALPCVVGQRRQQDRRSGGKAV